jgi:hypothetical protein
MNKDEFQDSLSPEEKEKLKQLDTLLHDKKFRKKLKAFPKETLKNIGFEFPEDKNIVVVDIDHPPPANKDKNTIYLRIKSSKDIKDAKSPHRGNMIISFFRDVWKDIKS